MFKIQDRAGEAVVMLHGEFGWDFDSSSIVSQLNEIEADKITVRINSPGGDAFAGIAIMNALREHHADVTCVVEGYAASAASVVAVGGGDTLIMRPQSQLMIHDAMIGFTGGNAEELNDLIKVLDSLSDSIAEVYARKAGGDVSEWREAMRAETWFTAQEAVEAGLADRVEDGASVAPQNFNMLNKFAGRRHDPPSTLLNRRKGDGMDFDKFISMVTDSVIAKMNTTKVNPPEHVAEAESNLCKVHKSNEPEGETDKTEDAEVDIPEVVTLDKASYEELKAAAELGWQAKEESERKGREKEVDKWVNEGRISASSRMAALKLMNESPDLARSTFGSNPINTIPRREVGYSTGSEVRPIESTAVKRSGLFQPPAI